MKRLISFFLLILSLLIFSNYKTSSFKMWSDCQNCIIQRNKNISSCESDIHNDFSGEYENVSFADLLKMDMGKINFVILYFDKDQPFSYFSKKVSFIFSGHEIDGIERNYYGYFKDYKQFRIIDGKKINFQLVKTDKFWIMGFPLIVTGF